MRSKSQGDQVNCLFKSKQIRLQCWHEIINNKSFKGIWLRGKKSSVVSDVKSGWIFRSTGGWALSGCERSWTLSRGFARDHSMLLHKHSFCQEKTQLYKSIQIILQPQITSVLWLIKCRQADSLWIDWTVIHFYCKIILHADLQLSKYLQDDKKIITFMSSKTV